MRPSREWLMRTFSGVLLIVVVLGIVGAKPVSAQVASPLQSGHYAPGVPGVRDVVTPPPGLFVLWYNWFLWRDTYVDRNGNELKTLNLSEIDDELPDVDVDIDLKGFATVPFVAWSSTFTLLGGARYIAGVAPNFLVTDYKVVATPDWPDPEPTSSRRPGGRPGGLQ